MQYKISVIMPIYNRENLLDRSIQSVINQTLGFDNLELILVDDFSDDNSKQVIERYSQHYANIFPIFLNENSGGPAIPKNTGLKNATADYVIFFDPDDYLMPDYCEILYDEIIKENADFVSVNSLMEKNGDLFYDMNYYGDNRRIIGDVKDLGKYKSFRCCGSIFSRKFLLDNSITFPNVKSGEDTYFVYKCFFNSSKKCFLDDYYGFVYFIQEGNSITQSRNKERILSSMMVRCKILEMLMKMGVIIEYDPFLIEFYTEFGGNWLISREDEEEIFKKILLYKNRFQYPVKLPIQYKVADLLLEKNKLVLLHYYRIFFSWLSRRNFIKKRFNPRKKVEDSNLINALNSILNEL